MLHFLGLFRVIFGFFFVIFGCKILGFKNPASVKEMTNMRYDHHPPTMGQNRVLGEISFSHVTSSILGVILGICVARNVCYKCVNISN